MPIDQATRQRLAALVNDALSETEAAELRRRIADDPELAEAFLETQRDANVVVLADRPPRREPPVVVKPVAEKLARRTLGAWFVTAIACVVGVVALIGYGYHRQQVSEIAAGQLRLFVAGPPELSATEPTEFTIATTDMYGDPVPSEIELTILSSADKPLWNERDHTSADGWYQAIIPAALSIPEGARLQVSASGGPSVEKVQVPLRRRSLDHLTHVSLDRKAYRPGETVYARSVVLARDSLEAANPAGLRFELLGKKGETLPGASVEGTTVGGVGAAALVLPRDAAAGRYTLSVRGLGDVSVSAQAPFEVTSTEPPTKPAEGQPPKEEIRVRFYPEGGALAPELVSRVFFSAHSAAGEPVELDGRVVNSENVPVAAVKTQQAGLGAFYLEPYADQLYRFETNKSSGTKVAADVPPVVADQKVVLSAGSGVFAPGQSLAFNVRASADDLPLLVAVTRRGATIALAPLVTSSEDGGANPVEIPLTDGAVGALRLTLFDYSRSPPRPVANRLVYRRPSRHLTVRAEGVKPAYRSGETVEIELVVENEQEKNAAATLGVCVSADANRTSLPADVLLRQSLVAGDLDVDALLADTETAALGLDLTLGTRGPNGRVAGAPLVFDNLGQLREQYQKILAAYRQQQVRWLGTLAAWCFFGGLGLWLTAAVLGLLGAVSGTHVWLSTTIAGLVCLIVGGAVVEGNGTGNGAALGVAFQTHSVAEPAEQRSVGESASIVLPSPFTFAPPVASDETLVWRPSLAVDESGRAKLSFSLPKSPAKSYWLRVDAFADGRLGALMLPIVVK